jgi:hypothetical protein
VRLPSRTCIFAASAVVALLVGCGSDDSPSQAELEEARSEGARAARQSERIKRLEQEVREQGQEGGSTSEEEAPPAPPPGGPSAGTAGTTNCGGGLSVGPNTSCPFAQNVRSEYEASGSSTVRAFSPATGETYVMSCTSDSPHVCTGGNNASVYFP